MGGNDVEKAFSPLGMNHIESRSGGSDLRVQVTISFSSGGFCVGPVFLMLGLVRG
jgi:hypothetical protein